jgi:hypothetical protein
VTSPPRPSSPGRRLLPGRVCACATVASWLVEFARVPPPPLQSSHGAGGSCRAVPGGRRLRSTPLARPCAQLHNRARSWPRGSDQLATFHSSMHARKELDVPRCMCTSTTEKDEILPIESVGTELWAERGLLRTASACHQGYGQEDVAGSVALMLGAGRDAGTRR